MKKSIGFQKRVLVVCFILMLGAWELHAQSYTPVPYNFGGVSEVTDDSLPDFGTPTDLSMDCLAANGYGQWTASYKKQNAFPYDSGSPGLFLLANALRAPSYDGSTGIVSSRSFVLPDSTYPVDSTTTNRSIVKCVTNLKGRVRYVWPIPNHTGFYVEGFDQCPPNDSVGRTGINLEFSSYPYNTTYGAYPLPLLGNDVIKTSAAIPFNTVPMVGHTIVTAAHESDPRDWFSIAMDTTFLYVVWEEYDSTGHYNIWECSQMLSTSEWTAPIEVASGGRRPTICADVRRALPDTITKACFDVAYITGLQTTDHLTWYNYDGGRLPHAADTLEMTKSCQDTAGGTWTYYKITHACMLDASWESITSSDTTPRAIYAIVTDVGGMNHLIMHKIKGGTQDAAAYYCDGFKIVNHAPGVNNAKFPVIDKPIRAFVNPYDGQKNDNFDEYHCMYQLARIYVGGSHKPLMMIHGAIVHDTLGPRVCLNFAGTDTAPGTVINRPDTLHRFYEDPALNTDGGDTDNYVGAVNQMGIHTHWRNGKQHYYLRDQRKFDEDIEENTLATESVFIDDGTSHGGTIGATVLPGKTMTLWSDRSIDDIQCTLNFPDTGVNHATAALIVGTGSGSPSKLEAVWGAYIDGDTSLQQVIVKPLSSIENYGVVDCYITVKMEGSGAAMTGGTYSYPSSISNPAYLNLHGGSGIWTKGFIADSSIVTLKYDQDVSETVSISGRATISLSGFARITNSILTDLAPTYTGGSYSTFGILGNSNWQNASDTVVITNSLINHGTLVMGGGASAIPTLPIVISGGKIDNTPIYAYAGPNLFTIQNVLFNDDSTYFYAIIPIVAPGAAIFLENADSDDNPFQTYNPITISGCEFGALPDSTDAILAAYYATDSNIMQHLNITGNTFNNGDYYGLLPHAAIELQSSEGLITDNTIEGNFQYGVIVSGENSFIRGRRTKSTVCSNLIRAGTIAGLYTDNTEGYDELNNIKVTGTGHISGINDLGRIIYSNYSANDGSGIYVSDRTGAPDLTGIHSNVDSAGALDVAAFDTIELNGGIAQINLVKDAHIRLGNSGEPWFWTNWCQNNILTAYSDDYCGCLGGGGGVSYVPLIVEDTGHSTSQLGNISHNFFGDSAEALLPENQDTGTGCGDSLNRGTPSSWIVGVSTPIAAAGFCYSADSNFTSWQNRPAGAIDCGEILPTQDKTKMKGAKTLSVLSDTSCREKFAVGNADDIAGDYGQSDSVLKVFIETCYDTTDSWQAFGDLDEADGSLYPTEAGAENYRNWLKTVLWLNTIDPLYYCTCAESIFGTYESIDAGRNLNAALAVIRYLDSSNRCPVDTTDNNNEYNKDVATRHMVWLDTVKNFHNGDTIDFPQDTTIPTIDEIGLSILRGPPALVQNDTTPTSGISNLTASNNPFSKETTLYFTTGEYAYISFQVFDVLGRVVFGDYKGSVQPPGSYSFTVDGTNWPDGTYYARITTPLGETRMLKLVKE